MVWFFYIKFYLNIGLVNEGYNVFGYDKCIFLIDDYSMFW